MGGVERLILPELTLAFDGRVDSIQEVPIGPLVDTERWRGGLVVGSIYSATNWPANARLSLVARSASFGAEDAPLIVAAHEQAVGAVRFGANAAGTLQQAAIGDGRSLGPLVQVYARWEQGSVANGPASTYLRVSLVGRSHPTFTPARIAGCVYWQRGDLGMTLVPGPKISAWWDMGGNSIAATQATDANRPTLGEGLINGRDGASFSGAQVLTTPTTLSLSTFTIFSVLKLSGTAGIVYEHSPDTNANDGCALFGTTGSTLSVRRGGTLSAKNLTVNWAVDNAPKIVRHEYGGTHATHQLYLNGAQQSLTDTFVGSPTGTAVQPFNVGARAGVVLPSTGGILEVAVFSPMLSAVDASALERRYFGPRYAITVA